MFIYAPTASVALAAFAAAVEINSFVGQELAAEVAAGLVRDDEPGTLGEALSRVQARVAERADNMSADLEFPGDGFTIASFYGGSRAGAVELRRRRDGMEGYSVGCMTAPVNPGQIDDTWDAMRRRLSAAGAVIDAADAAERAAFDAKWAAENPSSKGLATYMDEEACET